MPSIPVRPKLFKYRLDHDNKAAKYEFSSIELNQDQKMLVDYNMGVRIDLIDRSVYGEAFKEANRVKVASAMPEAEPHLSERDKFLLSEHDHLPEVSQPKLSAFEESRRHAKLVAQQMKHVDACEEQETQI